MTELLIEIEAKRNGEEIYFYDAFLEDVQENIGSTVSRFLEKAKGVDTIVLYLSEDDDLIDMAEVEVEADNCTEKFLEELNKLIKKAPHED